MIEITDEMMDAGVLAFVSYDSRFEGPENAVFDIWNAMKAAQSRPDLSAYLEQLGDA
jgi:hypothetical protein